MHSASLNTVSKSAEPKIETLEFFFRNIIKKDQGKSITKNKKTFEYQTSFNKLKKKNKKTDFYQKIGKTERLRLRVNKNSDIVVITA